MRFEYNTDTRLFEYHLDKHPVYDHIEIKRDNILIVGYKFELSNQSLDENLIVDSFLKKDFSSLNSIPADFIFLCKSKAGVTIVTDTKGSFNFYFGKNNNTLYGDIFIDRLVKKFDLLSIKKINILWFLTLIDTNYNSDTFFTEISKQQPGYVTNIDNVGNITATPPNIQNSIEELSALDEKGQAQYLLQTTKEIIRQYSAIRTNNSNKLVFDLSSGLDSSLLCAVDAKVNKGNIYRSIFDFSQKELPENTKIIDDFVSKNEVVGHRYVDIRVDYKLDDKKIYTTDSYLFNIASYEAHKSLKNVKDLGSNLYIAGSGGNQIFSNIDTQQYYKDYLYNFYYKAVRFSQTTGIYEFLEKSAQDILLNKNYYQRLQPTYSYLEDTALNNTEATFEAAFKIGVIRLTPYNDPRIAITLRNNAKNQVNQKSSIEIRKSVLKNLVGSVYLQSQFYSSNTQRYIKTALSYITENKHSIKKLTNDVVLQELDLVDLERFCLECSKGSILNPEIGYFYYHLNRLSNYLLKIEKSTKVKFIDG